MNQTNGLFQALRANPGDGTLRAAYSDWLQENGYE